MRVRAQLTNDDPLRSRASTIAGHSNFLNASFPEAEDDFADARETALDEHDENEALHGLLWQGSSANVRTPARS